MVDEQLLYLDPDNALDESLLGYDTFTDPVYQTAIHLAYLIGYTGALTEPVHLPFAPDKLSSVVFIPVYKNASIKPTPTLDGYKNLDGDCFFSQCDFHVCGFRCFFWFYLTLLRFRFQA